MKVVLADDEVVQGRFQPASGEKDASLGLLTAQLPEMMVFSAGSYTTTSTSEPKHSLGEFKMQSRG